MRDAATLIRFEATVLIHLDAAYNLARWLTHDELGAQDALQDACLRAFRFFDSLHGPSPKAWFMAVVRNACMPVLKVLVVALPAVPARPSVTVPVQSCNRVGCRSLS